jgi:hypothetical protein
LPSRPPFLQLVAGPQIAVAARRMLAYLHFPLAAMRPLLLLCVLPVLTLAFAPAHAQSGFAVGDSATDGKGVSLPAQPMAWRYATLEAAQDAFERQAGRLAPNSILTFRLPNVDAGGATSLVELVQRSQRTPLPMVAPGAFLLAGSGAGADEARVVVNRDFPPGQMKHPTVRVRSYDVPPGVVRMGDVRLACQAQMAMAKTVGFKVHAALGAASLFGFDVCNKVTVAFFDAPGNPFNTIVVDDGERHARLAASAPDALTLGDKQWSDDARISFTWQGQAVR